MAGEGLAKRGCKATPGGLYTTVLESRSLRSGCLGVGFWRGPSSGVFGRLPGPQVLGGGGARWAPFQEDTARSCGLSRYDLVPSQRPPLMPSPQGLGFQTKIWGGGTHHIPDHSRWDLGSRGKQYEECRDFKGMGWRAVGRSETRTLSRGTWRHPG